MSHPPPPRPIESRRKPDATPTEGSEREGLRLAEQALRTGWAMTRSEQYYVCERLVKVVAQVEQLTKELEEEKALRKRLMRAVAEGYEDHPAVLEEADAEMQHEAQQQAREP